MPLIIITYVKISVCFTPKKYVYNKPICKNMYMILKDLFSEVVYLNKINFVGKDVKGAKQL